MLELMNMAALEANAARRVEVLSKSMAASRRRPAGDAASGEETPSTTYRQDSGHRRLSYGERG